MPSINQAAIYIVAFCSLATAVCTELRAEVDFNQQIRPILAEFCFHCHGPDSGQRAADLRLDLEHEAHRSVIRANQADRSELIHRVSSSDAELVMPPPALGKKLSEQQIAVLRQWINEGANYSAHWAYQPIRESSQLLAQLPLAVSPEHSPIDRFLEHKLSAANLNYSPEVSRQQLIRRAAYDLTGLPPTWSEVEAFVADDSPDFMERLIDRLLTSPSYGERWGRHWLDIARYADTHGGAAIGFTTFPFSYTYRDYVIRVLNSDLPFNRFILEQIAADQLGLPDNDPSLAALGFLTVGMQFRNYHDTIDDQIDVISRGLMGLTVTCARCHDHKFDEISTADYYSLYASIAPSKSPSQLPVVGEVNHSTEHTQYQQELKSLQLKLQSFAREQSEVMRARLRMQVGLYLTEIAKGVGEQDTSTTFLSYRTDDIRPVILNRWLAYLKDIPHDEAVFGPWIEMHSWGNVSPEEFAKRSETYLMQLSGELDPSGRAAEKIHALRAEPPKWNPLVVDALIAKKPKSLVEVAEVYGNVFVDQQRLWLQALLEAANEASSAEKVLPDDHAQHQVINSPTYRQLRHHLYGPNSPCSVSDEEAVGLTNRTINDLIGAKRGAIHQLHLSAAGSPPRAMVLREDPQPTEHFVFLRGNPLARGEPVQPRFLSVLNSGPPKLFENGKRRLGVAQSVIDPTNPLTSRVIVNWAWQHHFGVGLVRTPDDFGTRGQPPTHPELLDYLANEFQKNGWSLKWLHRQIMLSKAYRQGAIENEAYRQEDPDNLLLWRMPRKRLDFESMRDAMLAVSGELDSTMGGKPIDLNATPSITRRSVYGFTNRDIIANLMSTFDAANPNACTAKRPETTVPQQTLFALNSDFIQDRAAKLASLTKELNLPNAEDRVTALIRRILGRNPSNVELKQALEFLRQSAVDSRSSIATPVNATPDSPAASATDANALELSADSELPWIQLAHALLASNEFIFLD